MTIMDGFMLEAGRMLFGLSVGLVAILIFAVVVFVAHKFNK